MKTKLLGNFLPSFLMRSMCFVLFMTASGCASTSKPIPYYRQITPSISTDAPDTFAIVPVKGGERDLYVAVLKKGDHVLVYTKDDRKLARISHQ